MKQSMRQWIKRIAVFLMAGCVLLGMSQRVMAEGNQIPAGWIQIPAELTGKYFEDTGDGTIFGSLKKYKNESFYREHAEFKFDTCYEKAVYQIVAVVITDISESGDFCYYDFSNYDRGGFLKCLDFIKENQLYETGCEIDYGDSLVMLSACEKSSKSSRLIVIGKKISKASACSEDF